MNLNPSTTLRGTVEKIIASLVPSEPERAQIVVEGADHLYKELRIGNRLTDASGNEVQLKPGAKVEIIIKAEPRGVTARGDQRDCGTGLQSSEPSQVLEGCPFFVDEL